jgi:hypothetical protein
VYLVLCASVVAGLFFGAVFGTLDVEDDDRGRSRLTEDHDFTVPVGAAIGAVVGFANEWMRGGDEYAFDPLANRGEGI